jgi:hypothetical protein
MLPSAPPYPPRAVRYGIGQATWLVPSRGASQLRDSTGITPASLRLHRPGNMCPAPAAYYGRAACARALELAGVRYAERQLGIREPGILDGLGVDQVRELAHAIRDPWRRPREMRIPMNNDRSYR